MRPNCRFRLAKRLVVVSLAVGCLGAALGAVSVVVPTMASMFWEISAATSSLLTLGAAGATGAATGAAGTLAALIRSRAWMQERI